MKYYFVGIGMDVHAGKGSISGDTIELLNPVRLMITPQGAAFAPSFILGPVDKAVFKYDYYSEITDPEMIKKIDESVVSIRAAAAGLVSPTPDVPRNIKNNRIK